MHAVSPVIELQKISRVFETDEVETHALSEIELTIQRGEYVSISGPSGSGKTTLLTLLGLLDVPTSGEFLLDSRPVAKLSAADRAKARGHDIGFVFQNFNLIGDLTVSENVELPLSYQGVAKGERAGRIKEALERVGMSHRSRHYPSQLSGGQQQRVAVARAIVGRPSILLADEPTGNLDSSNADTVMELLEDLHADGATICMVTHNPEYARRAQRDIRLFDGRIIGEVARHEEPIAEGAR